MANVKLFYFVLMTIVNKITHFKQQFVNNDSNIFCNTIIYYVVYNMSCVEIITKQLNVKDDH